MSCATEYVWVWTPASQAYKFWSHVFLKKILEKQHILFLNLWFHSFSVKFFYQIYVQNPAL